MGDAVTGRGPGDELLVEVRGRVRIVTLHRPDAMNATDAPLHGEVSRIWAELDADPDVAAIVLTGSGGAFSAGGDLHLLQRMVHDQALRDTIMAEGLEIVRSMTAVRAPIIAAVNGPAVGLGCSLAGMSDLVVVEEQAYFADPHVALGLVAADGGVYTWPFLMSLLRAKEFLFFGDRIPAEEAVRLGLANRVVPTGTSLDVALELADRLVSLPQQALRETKATLNRAILRGVATDLEPAIAAEWASFDEPAFQANLARMLARSASR